MEFSFSFIPCIAFIENAVMVECGVATWYEYLGLCIAPCSSLSSE
jgi:hypothetical protein